FIDLIGCRDPYKRALEIARYEPDVVLFHVGISTQRARGITSDVLVKEAVKVKQETGMRVGVAGGLKPGLIKPLISQGIDVVVVGSAITSSPNPVDVVITILREMLP
ncbi:MAG: orotidine 5-phosphate decarboxylase, partial [Desulfurococcaceae archaeon]